MEAHLCSVRHSLLIVRCAFRSKVEGKTTSNFGHVTAPRSFMRRFLNFILYFIWHHNRRRTGSPAFSRPTSGSQELLFARSSSGARVVNHKAIKLKLTLFSTRTHTPRTLIPQNDNGIFLQTAHGLQELFHQNKPCNELHS